MWFVIKDFLFVFGWVWRRKKKEQCQGIAKYRLVVLIFKRSNVSRTLVFRSKRLACKHACTVANIVCHYKGTMSNLLQVIFLADLFVCDIQIVLIFFFKLIKF